MGCKLILEHNYRAVAALMLTLDVNGPLRNIFDPKFSRFHALFYRPQRSCGQGNVFTGVCLSTGGGRCLPQCMLGCHNPPPPDGGTPRDGEPPPRGPGRPPRWRNPPDGEPPPPGPGRPPRGPGRPPLDGGIPPDGEPPPSTQDQADPSPGDQADPPGSRLQHTVYERPVRILLECILVFKNLTKSYVGAPWRVGTPSCKKSWIGPWLRHHHCKKCYIEGQNRYATHSAHPIPKIKGADRQC